MSAGARVVPHVTCLGCGCACDDIVVTVTEGRITEAQRACPIGVAWFGDGSAPSAVMVRGEMRTLDEALDTAASLLSRARQPVVHLGPELSCEAQRAATAVADALGAMLDGTASATVGSSILAAQRRGRASLTLGELRHRADTVLFWGVDPAVRHPRFASRFIDTPGLYVGEARSARVRLAVDVGDLYAPRDVDLRVRIDPAVEAAALAALTAMMGRAMKEDALRDELLRAMSRLAERLEQARYVAIIYDAEAPRLRHPAHAEALMALGHALNAHRRAGLLALRGGGNRNGAEAVLTWQTGYPMAVDFARGAPRYEPTVAADRLAMADVVLLIGDDRDVRPPEGAACVTIGPRASAGAHAAADVVIDTGVPGIHESGMAFRMDDLPLPLRQLVSGPPSAAVVLGRLRDRLPARRREEAT